MLEGLLMNHKLYARRIQIYLRTGIIQTNYELKNSTKLK